MSTVRLETNNGVAEIIFDEPEARHNILTTQVMEEFAEVLEQLEKNADAEMVLIRSAKRDSFIAGADIKEIAELTDAEEAEEKARRGQELYRRLSRLPQPTAALIGGTALGGGFELSLWCDYRFAVDIESTRIGLPEVNLGVIPGFGGTQMLPRIAGIQTALDLILTGRTVDARGAEKRGIVDRRFPEGFARDWAVDYVRRRGSRRKQKAGSLMERIPFGKTIIFETAKKRMRAKTGGHYPAPEEALAVMKKSAGRNLDRGLALERQQFARLATGKISENLLYVYFQQERVKKLLHPAEESIPREPDRGAVVGSGVMGGGIAWLFTKHDLPVRMKDIEWAAIAKAYETIRDIYTTLRKKRKVNEREVQKRENLATGTLDYSGFAKIPFVIEAIVEKPEIKRSVYAELEDALPEDAVIASNTSSLSIAELSREMQHPERMVGMHFFNPPNRMPLVEVVAGERSAPWAVAAAVRLSRRLGKMPVVVGDCPGFLVNRLLMPYLNEAAYLAGEGVDIRRIDRAMTTFGWPMGPFMLLDMVGIDVGYKVARELSSSYGRRMEVAPLFARIGEETGLLGNKGGRGFYLHGGSKTELNSDINAPLRAVRSENGSGKPRYSDEQIQQRLMLPMVLEAVRALEEGIAGSAEDIDISLVLGTGFPPFRGGLLKWVDSAGAGELIAEAERLQGETSVSGPQEERFAVPALLEGRRNGGAFIAAGS